MKKGRRHGQALFVSAGQIAGHPVFRAAETKPGKHLFYPFFYFLPGQSVSASEKSQIFPDSKHTVERKFLRHISHIGPGRRPCCPQVYPRHRQFAAAGGKKSAKHFKRCRLACAVRPQKPEDFSLMNLKRCIVHSGEITKPAHQIFYFNIHFAGNMCRFFIIQFKSFKRTFFSFQFPKTAHKTVFQTGRHAFRFQTGITGKRFYPFKRHPFL